MQIWGVYLVLIAVGVPAVLVLHFHAGLVAAVMIVVAVLANLLFNQRVCLDCGHQWKV